MVWMISANGKMYDYASSFAQNGFIDWRERANYSINDIVYIYCTKPFQRVMYKCKVVQHSMPFSDCIDDADFWLDKEAYENSKTGLYARLELLEQVDTPHLSLDALIAHGLSAAPQGPIKVQDELCRYIDRHFNDCYAYGLFADVDEEKEYHEGHVRTVKVDVYERSSIARWKCMEYHGSHCLICGFDFADRYGDIGNGFIHIHHLRPLHTIREDYVVNYKNDLIPVCPNCHAMIHRIPGGENMSVAEIKQFLLTPKASESRSDEKPLIFHVQTESQVQIEEIQLQTENTLSIPEIKVGTAVLHKVYGEGVVSKTNDNHTRISITFSCGEKVFIMPDAFEKGYITIK